MTVDLVSAMARIPHLSCHAECAPSLPGGRDGSGHICRECALALAAELVAQADTDLWRVVRQTAWAAGYGAGFEAGWAACMREVQARWERSRPA